MTRIQLILAVGFTCGVLLICPRLALSQELDAPPAPIPPADEFYARVSSYQPSFIGWVFSEEPHLNFLISIQYPFLPFEAFGANTADTFIGHKAGLYLAYTGRFDFYFQRQSGPVISREQNPGLYIDFDRCFDQPLILTLGYFHDSNGQVINSRAQYLAIADHAQDFVSRGWDYALVSLAYTLPWPDRFDPGKLLLFKNGGTLSPGVGASQNADQWKLTLCVQGLGFLEKQGFGAAWKEEDVFWEDVTVQSHRSDFDGIRFSIILENAYYRIADTLRSGYTATHLTNDLSFTFRIGKWLPLSIQYHAGYGPDLSAYHIPSQYMSLGCELYGVD